MFFLFFVEQKTEYEMRISDWSSDVCSSDLPGNGLVADHPGQRGGGKAADLRIDRSQHRMRRHDDLVGGERDQGAARHRQLRYDRRDLAAMLAQGGSDLQ